MKRVFRVIVVSLLLIALASGFAVFAEGGTITSLTLQPKQTQLKTGQVLEMLLIVEQTDLPVVGCALQFTLMDGYQFDSLQAGPDIEASELSYSFDGSSIVLLYMDDDLGSSPAGAGAQLAVISLAAVSACETEPLSCTMADVVGGDFNETVQMEADIAVGTAIVTGQEVARPTPLPHYVEAGGEEQPMPEQPAAAEPAPTPQTAQPPRRPESMALEADGQAGAPKLTAAPAESTPREIVESSPLPEEGETTGTNVAQTGLRWQWPAAFVVLAAAAAVLYFKRGSHHGKKDPKKDQ